MFKCLLLMVFIPYAFADDASDAIFQMFTKARVTTNSGLSRAVDQTCQKLVAQAHVKECQDHKIKTANVDDLALALKKINLAAREQEFIRKAHAEQMAALTCEIKQMRALYNEESVKPFYGVVMEDLCQKLPELKLRWDLMEKSKKIIESANSKFETNNRASNFRFADTSQNAGLLKTISKYGAELKKQQSIYLQLKSSMWRSDDPYMDSYIHEAMTSDSKRKEVCDGSSKNQDYKTYSVARKNFQDKIIYSMIRRAQDDLFAIGKSPDKTGVQGMKVILNRSDWQKNLDQGSAKNRLENAVMMCDLDQKYLSGDDRSQRFLAVGSFALGGASVFLKVAKFATFLKPGTVQGLLTSSRVLMYASSFPVAPLSLQTVANACTGGDVSYSLQGQNCPLTSTGNVDMNKMIDIETIRLKKENCALNIALAGFNVGSTLIGFLGEFQAAKVITAKSYVPITKRPVIKVTELRALEKKVVKQLDDLGVGHSTIKRDPSSGVGLTTLEGNVKLWKSQALELTPFENKEFYGSLLKVEKLPTPGKATGPSTNAFLHPEMGVYKKKLEDLGYSLAVDTSLSTTGAEAYFWGYNKVLALNPKSNWQTFVHEFQHAEFNKYMYPRFSKLQSAVNRGEKLEDILRLKVAKKLSPTKIKKLQALMEKQISENGINEILSVSKELEVLGFRKYIPGVGTRSRKYALRHQITDLQKLPKRNSIQEASLLEAKNEYKWLERYEQTLGFAIGTAGSAVAVVGTDKVMSERYNKQIPENYLQIIYDEGDNILAQNRDGSWVFLEENPKP